MVQGVRELQEEMSLSAEFDLPLPLLTARARTGLDPETTRRLLGVFRSAEFVTRPAPSGLAVILPNTDPDGARAVERRLREVLPDAAFGLTPPRPDDEAPGLLERARSAP